MSETGSNVKYSFVLPIFHEEETIPLLFTRMNGILSQLDGPAEVICVNDGSRDQSGPLLNAIAEKDARYKIIHFSRNFGHQIAITAGMDFASGAATIVMDADLQDPPEVVLDMVAKWKEGFEVVYALRISREGETWFKKLTAALYYRILKKLTSIDMPADVGDFRLIDRKALLAFRQLRETNRYVRGMFSWLGFKQTGVTYIRQARQAGYTKYPLAKMLKLARDGIIGFSATPLRFALNVGFFIAAVSFLAGLWALFLKVSGYYTVDGWTSLTMVVSFIGGVQLMVIGILGEYVGRIHDEVKNRPLYLVRDMKGFSADNLTRRAN